MSSVEWGVWNGEWLVGDNQIYELMSAEATVSTVTFPMREAPFSMRTNGHRHGVIDRIWFVISEIEAFGLFLHS
jgi:hypothetical protein